MILDLGEACGSCVYILYIEPLCSLKVYLRRHILNKTKAHAFCIGLN